MSGGGWVAGIDIGGTFTDVVAIRESDGSTHHLKVPSSKTDPGAAVLNALKMLASVGAAPDDVGLLLHGTTVVTNAIIERKLARTALVTTEGFADVLEIGRHWRTDLYDPFMKAVPPLVPRKLRLEVRERMNAHGEEVEPLDRRQVSGLVTALKESGVEATAIVFLHSYRNPRHEEELSEMLRETWPGVVCGSAELSREIREYERSSTTALNAALIPLIDRYVTTLVSEIHDASPNANIYITQSNGGALSTSAARRRPVALALSGPVAGVVACCDLARRIGNGNLIGLDMGGTSTDIAVIVGGEPRYTNELSIGEMVVRLPSIDIDSIGAGGGSIAYVDAAGSLRVGPESAGSLPGPACYARGGDRPTITDCQLLLGRLSEDAPLAGSLRLQAEVARAAVENHVAGPLSLSIEEAAVGIVEVANAAMEAAVRVALRKHGDDPRDFALVAFGGAGALHAVELAQKLSVKEVIVPPHPGTLSALGVLSSDVRLDFACSEVHRSDDLDAVKTVTETFETLEHQAQAEIDADEALRGKIVVFERYCDIRYCGQAYEVTIAVSSDPTVSAPVQQMIARFHDQHMRMYGFASVGEVCELVTFRVAARIRLERPSASVQTRSEVTSRQQREVYVRGSGFLPATTLNRASLAPGDRVEGPAIIYQVDATTFLPPSTTAAADDYGNLRITISGGAQ
ncbi:MAG: hydantoinase/oxoprolinase family protein [bacterium]|nr:hydantoinase/oxoprolinase family protein [bacterium]